MKQFSLFLALIFAFQAIGATITDNVLTLGDATNAAKKITFGRGANKPFISWDPATGSLSFSNNGTLVKKLGSGSGGGEGGVSILENASFEDGLNGWSNSGGTFTQGSYANATETEIRFGSFVATAAGQYIETTAKVLPTFVGGSCAAYSDFLTANAASWKLQIYSGTDLLLENALLAVPSWQKTPIVSFPCPSTAGALVKMRFVSTAAGTINVDRAYLGSNNRLINIADDTAVGTVIASFLTEAQFQGIRGKDWVLADGRTIPAASKFATLFGSTTIPDLRGRFLRGKNNGTTTTLGNPSGEVALGVYQTDEFGSHSHSFGSGTAANAAGANIIRGYYTADVPAGTIGYSGGAETRPKNVTVNYFIKINGGDSQIAITPEAQDWFIDANIGGADVILSNASQPSYVEATNANLDLVLRQGSASAQIACANGTASSGLSCTSANESIGMTFNVPVAGFYEVCTDFTHAISGAAGNTATTVYQLIETPNNATTILQEGGQRTGAGANTASYTTNSYHSVRNCGTFYFSSASQRTVRLMYEQIISGVQTPVIAATRGASLGQHDIKFVVRNLLQQYNRPYLVGNQVLSQGATSPDIQSVVFGSGADCGTQCSTGDCNICSRVGSKITSVSHLGAAGSYNLNGIDGTKYICTGGGVGANYVPMVQFRSNSNATTARLQFAYGGAGNNVAHASVICIGEK